MRTEVARTRAKIERMIFETLPALVYSEADVRCMESVFAVACWLLRTLLALVVQYVKILQYAHTILRTF